MLRGPQAGVVTAWDHSYAPPRPTDHTGLRSIATMLVPQLLI